MPKPTLILEAGFGAEPFVEPTWTRLDTAGHGVRKLAKRHGKRARFLSLPPAEVTIVASNANGALDPNNPNSAYHPNVKRDTQLRVRLDTSRDTRLPVNLLGLDQAHFQSTSVVGWENRSNAALEMTADQQAGPGDERSLKVTATAGTTTTPARITIQTTGTGTAAVPLTVGAAGQAVTFQFKILALTTGRGSRIFAEWYDSAGTLISTINYGGTLSASRTDRWVTLFGTGTVPTGARFVRLLLEVAIDAVNGEVYDVGRVSVALGAFKPWTIPGGIYPVFRGHVLDWDAGYDPSLSDGWVTITATDIFRLMAEHQLWPSVVEHDLLDGFAGMPPRYYFPFDEGDTPFFRGYARLDSGLSNRQSTSVLETQRGSQRFWWDPRPFTSFGGNERFSIVRLPTSVIADYGAAWGVECLFMSERPSGEQYILDLPSVLTLRLVGKKLVATLFYTDGTISDVIASPIIAGRTYLALVTVDANGDLRLYLNDVFIGGQAGSNRSRKGNTGDWAIGARAVNDFPLDGEVGRVAFYDWLPALSHASALWGAHVAPWGFNATVGARAQFLLEEFRHRRDNAGADVPDTYPGLPAGLIFCDNPSDIAVTDMNPESRSLLDYLRSLEATESGYLKVKADGRVRLRRRHLVMSSPRKPGATLSSSGAAGTIPFRDVKLGRNSDVVTVVNYSRSFIDVETEQRSKLGIAAHGEVAYSLGALESDTETLAKVAAVDLLNRNAVTPPHPKAERLVLFPNDPAVGWAVVMFEPGDHAFLDTTLPQYSHAVAYEVLEANLDFDQSGATQVTLNMVGD